MAVGGVVAVRDERFNHLVLLGRAAVRVWGLAPYVNLTHSLRSTM